MPSSSSAQIFSNSAKCRVSEPFGKCRHQKGCSHISTYIILKSDIPSKVLQRDLGERAVLLDMNLSHGKHLMVCHEIADRFANLENLGFVQVKTLKSFPCVS